jgi:AraC family transcriptional activator of mtrCDE
LSASDLDNLMRALHIEVVALTEILVPRGYRAAMGRLDAPGIHYTLAGKGRVSINGGAFQPLAPHLLIIVPPNTPFTIEVDGNERRLKAIEPKCWQCDAETGLLRVKVQDETPEVVQICGFFNASFGPAIGLFREASVPIVEQFEPRDRIDDKLREAMAELLQQEVGMGEMTASLLKQVIISLVRRSMMSSKRWMERFSILRDHRVTRAFAEMAARPGAPHTVESLAHCAGMSRSTFMARFRAVLGRSPMAVLRDLRMRQAALDLTTTTTPVEVVARNVGYESRSSFVRAFKSALGQDPTEYRAAPGGRSRASVAGG